VPFFSGAGIKVAACRTPLCERMFPPSRRGRTPHRSWPHHTPKVVAKDSEPVGFAGSFALLLLAAGSMEGLSDQVGGKSQQYERRDRISKDRRETWAASNICMCRDRSTGEFIAFSTPASSIPATAFEDRPSIRLATAVASSQAPDALGRSNPAGNGLHCVVLLSCSTGSEQPR